MAKRSLLTDRLRFRTVVGREAGGRVARRSSDDQYRVRPMWHVVSRLASRVALSALFATVFLTILAQLARAEPLSLEPPRYAVDVPNATAPPAPTRVAAARGNMGGGFIEFLF